MPVAGCAGPNVWKAYGGGAAFPQGKGSGVAPGSVTGALPARSYGQFAQPCQLGHRRWPEMTDDPCKVELIGISIRRPRLRGSRDVRDLSPSGNPAQGKPICRCAAKATMEKGNREP
jgi:hypothetical protein